MKALIAIAALTASVAHAAASYHPIEAGSIVTPDVATGFRVFEYFNVDVNGDMVVCERPDYSSSKCGDDNKKWKPLRSIVPPGKTFVGFRATNRDYGYRILEVYWK